MRDRATIRELDEKDKVSFTSLTAERIDSQ